MNLLSHHLPKRDVDRDSSDRLNQRRHPAIPLHFVLILLFVGLLLGTVGTVEYLWVRNGQQAVQDLTNQLMDKVGNQVALYLDRYLYVPQLINRLNADAVSLGGLNLQDLPAVEHYLFTQLNQFESISSIQVGDRHNNFRMLTRQNNLRLLQADAAHPTRLEEYAIDSTGHKTQLLDVASQSIVRHQLWYQTALFAEKPTWGALSRLSQTGNLFLTATLPVYDAQHQERGVFSSAISLDAINVFLRSLQIGQSGQVFILEQDGWTVASSASPVEQNAPFQRSNLIDSPDPIARAAARSVIQQFDDFSRIDRPQQIMFSWQGERHFLRATPFRDGYGLNWLVVVTVPEVDFMARINANTRTTILLSTGALLIAVMLGLVTARCITRPIQHLSTASWVLANGQWHEVATQDNPIAELQVLNQSFSRMARQLQRSFNQVTTALQESESRFAKIFRTSPDSISIVSVPENRHLEINDCFLDVTGYTRDEVIDQTLTDLHLIADPAQAQQVQHFWETQQAVSNLEFDIRTKSGQIKTVLLSSELIELDGQPCILSIFRDFTDRKQLELALQRSEAKLSDVLNGVMASIASYRITADGTWQYEYWSEGCEAVFGYTAEEFLANQTLWRSRVFPADLAQVIETNPRYLSRSSLSKNNLSKNNLSQNSFTLEYRFYHRDGSLRWISGYMTSRQLETDCWLINAVELDITHRKQAEDALQQSEATKNQILKAIPDLIVWMNTDGTCIDFIEGNNIPLITEACVVGKNLYDYMPTDLAQQRMTLVQRALQTGEVQVDEQQLTLGGEDRYEEVRVVAVDTDRILTIIRDVTDRKRSEAEHQRTETALRESEERFRLAFNSAAIGMALISLDDRWLKVNPMLCRMLGYSEVELLVMNASSLVHSADMERLQDCQRQVLLAEHHSAQAQLRYCSNGDRLVWGLLNLSLVQTSDQQPLYYVAQIQDVTEQLAIDRLKNEFISIVSHELRTPLTAIRGFLGLLDTGLYVNQPDKAKHMIKQALTNTERLVRLVNDILELERLDSGKVQLVMDVYQAQDLMQRAIEGVQSIADQALITLTLVPTTAQVCVAADAIIQTLTNLLSNAIKFSPPHSSITLSAQPQSEVVLFSVQDQGRGIPADKLKAIFGRFQQVDASDSRQKGGTGLGLAICQSIVQQHGGSIWVESTLGKGSTFYFTVSTPGASPRSHV